MTTLTANTHQAAATGLALYPHFNSEGMRLPIRSFTHMKTLVYSIFLAVLLLAAEATQAQEPAPAPAPRRPATEEPVLREPAPKRTRTSRLQTALEELEESERPQRPQRPARKTEEPSNAKLVTPETTPAPSRSNRRVVQQNSSGTYVAPKESEATTPKAGTTQPADVYPPYQNRQTAKASAEDRKAIANAPKPSISGDTARKLSATWMVPETDYDRLIIPEDSLPSDYEERLVQTAWRNLPTNRAAEAKVRQSYEMLRQVRRSWFTDIVFFAQTNFTDYGTGAGARPTISAAPSGLGAGLSFNLGQFVNYGSRVRHSKEVVRVAMEDLNYQKHFMRSETIKRHQSFLMYRNLVKSQLELANQQEMTLKVMKLNFETGQVPVEEFAKIQKAYADAAQLVITSKHNMFGAKAYLEEWIGVPLEEVK